MNPACPLTRPSDDAVQRIRKTSIERLHSGTALDLFIVGGGIHGALAARIATESGLRVGLLTCGAFGEGTSSRNSKMLHGGLRYLRTGDYRQVLEGVNAREHWLRCAPHLTRATDFLFPVYRGELQKRILLNIALSAYDILAFPTSRHWHRWTPAAEIGNRALFQNPDELSGGYLYRDAQMQDAALVRETIFAAQQKGAVCLNHAPVLDYSAPSTSSQAFVVRWRDALSGQIHSTQSRTVLNCAGPQVFQIHAVDKERAFAEGLAFSRGTHLIFDFPWTGPALTLPIGHILGGRCYFVLPYQCNGRTMTLVGTTERKVSVPENDAMPSADEVSEILARLAVDLPSAPFERDAIVGQFAGTRTFFLPVRVHGKSTADLARSHHWALSDEGRAAHLLGGKWTTAPETALQGIRSIWKTLDRKGTPVEAKELPYPGAEKFEEHIRDFKARCDAAHISSDCCIGAIQRLGGLVRYLGTQLTELPGAVLEEEILFAITAGQIASLRDAALWFDLEKFPSQGVYAQRLTSIASILDRFLGNSAVRLEEEAFQMRQARLFA